MSLALLSALAAARGPVPPEQREERSFQTDVQGHALELVWVQRGERLQEMELRHRFPDGTERVAIAFRDGRWGTGGTMSRCWSSKMGVADFWWLGFDGFREPRRGDLPSSWAELSLQDLTKDERRELMRSMAQSHQRERPWWVTLERERGGPYLLLSVDADHDGSPELTQRVVLEWQSGRSSWVRRCARRHGLADG